MDGRTVAVGAADLLDTVPNPGWILELNEQGKTAMYVGVDDRPVGVVAVAVADTIRADALEAIKALHSRGVKVIMATGDAERVARNVAAELSVDEVRAELMPEDKLTIVKELQAQGHTVAMVGDGVNDTPALAQADIGVAMGAAGSPAAIETADIALMADRLPRLPHALGLARRTVRTMRVNVDIALLTVALLLAGVLFGGVTMSLGMLVHEASVLLVIAIAMLLLRPTLKEEKDRDAKRTEILERAKKQKADAGASRLGCSDYPEHGPGDRPRPPSEHAPPALSRSHPAGPFALRRIQAAWRVKDHPPAASLGHHAAFTTTCVALNQS